MSALPSDAPAFDYQDSAGVPLAAAVDLPVEALIPAFFAATPGWVHRLMVWRNRLVAPLGLKTGPLTNPTPPAPPFQVGQYFGLFRLIELTPDAVVLGEEDRHLDFRLRLALVRTPEAPRLTLSTQIKRHNALGHLYLALVLPLHRRIVRASLAALARRLSPPDPTSGV